MFRRFRHAVALATAVSFLALGPSAAAAQELFPRFEPRGALFDHGGLVYNPTDEWIFPSVVPAGELFEEPLAPYYLYAAPHDGVGGISLFLGDSLDGPWTEHVDNPVIARTWDEHFSVSHVSSPETLWLEDEGRLLLYFHGENWETRLASSTDGVTFTYEDLVLTAGQAGPDVAESAYARVVEHTIPRFGNRFTMTFMDRVGPVRRIRLAVSDDARAWQVLPEVLVHPRGAEGRNISSAILLPWDGRNLVAYHGSAGNVHVTDVGPDFDQERHLGVLYESGRSTPEHGRAAAPFFVTDGDRMHLFYEAGQRGSTTLAHAVADLTRLQPLTHPHYEFTDVAPGTHYHEIHALATARWTTGCGTLERYCPDRKLTRAEVASFLARSLDLPLGGGTTRFTDVQDRSTHAAAIEAIAAAGLTNGCGADRYCPDRELTRAEMASFLRRALQLPQGSSTTRFVDVVPGSTHAPAIESMATAGITTGCGRPDRYCPDRTVTRAEMASFLIRGFAP